MKKLISILLSITFVLGLGLLFSCKNQEPASNSRSSSESTTQSDYWVADTITVYSSDWQLSGTAGEKGSYFYCTMTDDNLTQTVFDKGFVSVYVFAEEGSTWYQRQLPVVQVRADDETTWLETIDYDYAVNSVRVFVTYSDFLTTYTPADMTFRIVKEWPAE